MTTHPSKSNIAKLKIIAEQYLANNSKLVQDLCDRLMADYQDNLEESKILNTNSNAIGDENNDEGYESGDNCSDMVEEATVEPTVSAMVNAKLEPGSTLANRDTESTINAAMLQKAIQWIKHNHENTSEYLQYLEYLEYLENVKYPTVELDIAEIESLPEEVQEAIQWIVSLDAESHSGVLQNIKSLISDSYEGIYTTSCGQEMMELEGLEPQHEQVLVDCVS